MKPYLTPVGWTCHLINVYWQNSHVDLHAVLLVLLRHDIPS